MADVTADVDLRSDDIPVPATQGKTIRPSRAVETCSHSKSYMDLSPTSNVSRKELNFTASDDALAEGKISARTRVDGRVYPSPPLCEKCAGQCLLLPSMSSLCNDSKSCSELTSSPSALRGSNCAGHTCSCEGNIASRNSGHDCCCTNQSDCSKQADNHQAASAKICGNVESLSACNASCFCGHSEWRGDENQCGSCCSFPSESLLSPSNITSGAFCRDGLSPKVTADFTSDSGISRNLSRSESWKWIGRGITSSPLQKVKVNWRCLLMLALLLPCVLSREAPIRESTTESEVGGSSYTYSVMGADIPNTTVDATVVHSSQGSGQTSSSQNSAPLSPGCEGAACSKPAALGDEDEGDDGDKSIHVERIKMMLIPIVTVAAAAVILVSTYYICRYKKCLCCQRQLDKCNSICDQCMRGDFGSSGAAGVVIDEDGEMDTLEGGGSITPTPGGGGAVDISHIRLAAPPRPKKIGRSTAKSHSAMYIFRQPSHSGSVSSSRGRLSKSLQHVESTSSSQRKAVRGSRGSLQSTALSIRPASRSDSIHRLLGGAPRTPATASHSTSFNEGASKGQSGNKGQASVGNSRQSSMRSLPGSVYGDGQEVPKGFMAPMRPY
ncbi:hypothetical protein EGW08_019194 [Elysia chlorotica]|uniref:Uncharacterized protein n=1 Tax=Elysia chlorotica TaxID=188477 RepID=A0A433SUW8_ELYCH|nr:hypothetical protein EGW08_019194 [Elysia chlorotica]